MKTILAISVIAAAFAFVPSAEATQVCDPNYNVCVGSYASGTCDNGYQSNSVGVYNYDANGYVAANAGTYCGGYPGWYAYNGVGAGATACDATWNCNGAGASWDSFSFGGPAYCTTYVQAYSSTAGQGTFQDLGCPAGSPPVIPALLP